MKGIFSPLPPDTLEAALEPIADYCESLAWVLDLCSGPLEYPYWDEDDPKNVLDQLHDQDGLPMGWFERGFLPKHAHCLVLDDWGYYLGFNPDAVSVAALVQELKPEQGLSPDGRLFDFLKKTDLLFVMRVAPEWWEAYCSDQDLLEKLRQGWDGRWVDSDRWLSKEFPKYPNSLS